MRFTAQGTGTTESASGAPLAVIKAQRWYETCLQLGEFQGE